MLKKEWQSLLKNKFMVVVIIAIMFIPTIYTTIFLGSMWDPYGNLDKLPVAVVNEDKSVVYNDKKMDVGSELVKNLKENNSLDFNFVDKDVADAGLKNGTYYMVVTIPKDFSEDATTLLDKNPKTMELKYETNPGTNYIASKMSESAVAKIRTSIQEKITKQYAETIFDQIHTLGDGLSEAADGTAKANDAMVQLKDGNDKITTNLNTLASSSLTFKDGADTLKVGLKQYTDGVATADNGVQTLKNGVDQYTAGVNSAKNGSSQLYEGIGSLTSQLPTLTGGVAQLSSNSKALNDGVAQVSSGVQSVQAGSNAVLSGLEGMSKQLKDSSDKTSQAIAKLQSDVNTFNGKNYGDAISNSLNSAGTAYGTMISDLQKNQTFKNLTADQQAQIMSVITSNGANIQTGLKNAGNNANAMKNELTPIMAQSNTIIQNMAQGVGQIQNGLDRQGTTPETKGLIQGMNELNQGLSAINTGITDSKKGLQAAVKNYTGGVDTINSNIPALSGGVSKLYLGVGDLTNGLTLLDTKSSELRAGSIQLNSGLNTLTSNNGTLNSGVTQLSDGASKISDGASQLSAGSSTLGEGLTTLQDGTTTLHNALSDGANKVNDLNDNDNTYKMVANPVETSGTEATSVNSNGNAMSAYMMNVALWVAAIAFCIMYPLTGHNGKVKSGFSWWLGKASVVAVVTIIQAIIMIFMLKAINGFSPVELGKTVFVACLASITFMTIMYFFNILMGKVGSFLMLIFMVVQLGGCAGTYPVELASNFYKVVKPYMPFSYGVHAFRSTICGGESIAPDIAVFVGLLVVFAGLTIVVFNYKAKKIENEEDNTDIKAEGALA